MLIISSTFLFVFVNLFWRQHTDLEVLRSGLVCCVVSGQSADPDVTTAGSNCIGQFSIVYVHFSLDRLLVGDLLFSWNTDICLTFFQQWTVRTPIVILKNLSSELNSFFLKVTLSATTCSITFSTRCSGVSMIFISAPFFLRHCFGLFIRIQKRGENKGTGGFQPCMLSFFHGATFHSPLPPHHP